MVSLSLFYVCHKILIYYVSPVCPCNRSACKSLKEGLTYFILPQGWRHKISHCPTPAVTLEYRKSKFHRKDIPIPQMRTLIHGGEAAPWSRCDHLLRARLCPSSDDRDEDFFRPPCRADTMLNQTTAWPGLPSPAPTSTPILPLLKSKLRVGTQSMNSSSLYVCLPLPNVLTLNQYPFSAFHYQISVLGWVADPCSFGAVWAHAFPIKNSSYNL